MNEEWALHSECRFPWKFHDWITNIDNGERRVRCPRHLVEEAAEGGTETAQPEEQMFPQCDDKKYDCCQMANAYLTGLLDACKPKPAPVAPKRMKANTDRQLSRENFHCKEHRYDEMCDDPPRCEPVETAARTVSLLTDEGNLLPIALWCEFCRQATNGFQLEVTHKDGAVHVHQPAQPEPAKTVKQHRWRTYPSGDWSSWFDCLLTGHEKEIAWNSHWEHRDVEVKIAYGTLPTPPAAPARREWTLAKGPDPDKPRVWDGPALAYGDQDTVHVVELRPGERIVSERPE